MEPLSLNQFQYTQGNPITFFDPTGMVQTGIGGACSGDCSRSEQKNEHRRGKGQTSASGGLLPEVFGVTFTPVPPPPAPAIPETAMFLPFEPKTVRTSSPLDPDRLRAAAFTAHAVGTVAELAADLGQRRLSAAALAALGRGGRVLGWVAGGLTFATGCVEGIEGERGGCVGRAAVRGGGFLAGCGFGKWIAGILGCVGVGLIAEEAGVHLMDGFHYEPGPETVPYVCERGLHIAAGFNVNCPPGYDPLIR
jgi:hypothetical protein